MSNLKLYSNIVLVIESLLSLLCMIHSSLGKINQLLYSGHKFSINITLKLCANYNIDGFYQLLPKKKAQLGRTVY